MKVSKLSDWIWTYPIYNNCSFFLSKKDDILKLILYFQTFPIQYPGLVLKLILNLSEWLTHWRCSDWKESFRKCAWYNCVCWCPTKIGWEYWTGACLCMILHICSIFSIRSKHASALNLWTKYFEKEWWSSESEIYDASSFPCNTHWEHKISGWTKKKKIERIIYHL